MVDGGTASTADNGIGGPFLPFYADRLRVQGPDHPDTALSLGRVLQAALRDQRTSPTGLPAPTAQTLADPAPADAPTVHQPSALPDGVGPDQVRLDGDHADLLAVVTTMAVNLQERETAQHGPDHPRALLSTVLLGHALAIADQLDGQIESARVLIEDAREGLAEAAGRDPGCVDPRIVHIARTLHHWVLGLVGEEPEY